MVCVTYPGQSFVPPGFYLYVSFHQDVIEYRKKLRPLRVRMLDGTVKTMLVDDSQIVSNLMVTICTKIGELSAVPRPRQLATLHLTVGSVGYVATLLTPL